MSEPEDRSLDHIHEPQDPSEPTIADMSEEEVVAFAQKIKQFLAENKDGVDDN